MAKPKTIVPAADAFDDQGTLPISAPVPTNVMAETKPKAVTTTKEKSSVTVIPGKKRGGLIRGDGCAQRGNTKGRSC